MFFQVIKVRAGFGGDNLTQWKLCFLDAGYLELLVAILPLVIVWSEYKNQVCKPCQCRPLCWGLLCFNNQGAI